MNRPHGVAVLRTRLIWLFFGNLGAPPSSTKTCALSTWIHLLNMIPQDCYSEAGLKYEELQL